MAAIIQSYWSMLLGALGKTLLLTLLSLFFAMIIGMIFALMNVGRSRVCNCIGTIYVDAVRGVPLIVLAYFIYFGVPAGIKMMGIQDFRLSALQAGTIALSMNCGAYMAEIIRAGIESVDKGQMEAARSLGLSYAKSMQKIILPQAVRICLPSLVNQFIITLKDSTILYAIGLSEVMYNAKIYVGRTMESFATYTWVAVFFLLIVTVLSFISRYVERRMNA